MHSHLRARSVHSSRRAFRRGIGTAAAVLCAVNGFGPYLFAATHIATWSGGISTWNNPVTWFHSNAPQSGTIPNNRGTITYDVVVPSGTVTQDIPGGVTIQ